MSLTQASVGPASRILTAATKHAKEHPRGGRQIIKHQEIGFKPAEMSTLAQTAELLECCAGRIVAKGKFAAKTMVTCAKVFTT